MTLKDQELQVIGADVQMIPLDAMKNWYQNFVKFSNEILKENLDYGIIPGTKKPTLLKAGAEKLRFVYGLSVEINKTDEIYSLEKDIYSCDYKVTVKTRSGQIISECEGSCGTHESKYFYTFIKAHPQPSFDEATILKDKGLGKRKKVGEEWIFLERIETKNKIGLRNTIQKMAQKRAFVGAILIATGASEFYTQDLEDMDRPNADGEIEIDQQDDNKKDDTNKSKKQPVAEDKKAQKERFNAPQFKEFQKSKDKFTTSNSAITEIRSRYKLGNDMKAKVEALYK